MKQTKIAIGFLTAVLVALIFSTAGHVSAQDGVTLCRGQSMTISTRLLQNITFGDPVPFQKVEFFDEKQDVLIAIRTTDLDGLARIDWVPDFTYPLGPTLLNITFRGNESVFLYPSAEWIQLTVLASTTIQISVDSAVLAPGDILRATATLSDDLATPLENQSLLLLHGSNIIASAVTDETGSVTFEVVCNESWCSLGENTLLVTFYGNHEHFYSSTVTSQSIALQKIPTSVTALSQPPETVQPTQALTLSLSLQPAMTAELHVFLDSLPYGILLTNTSGTTAIAIPIGVDVLLGPHQVTVNYLGTPRYASSSMTIQFTVTSPLLARTESLETPLAGDTTTFIVTLHDTLYRPVLLGSLLIENTQSSAVSSRNLANQSGIVEIPVSFQFLKGPTLLLLTLSDNPYITNCSWTVEVLVWSLPSMVLTDSNVCGYASPGQEVMFTFRICDFESDLSLHAIVFVEPSGTIRESMSDDYGMVQLVFRAPVSEGSYNLSATIIEDRTAYILSAVHYVPFTVTRVMPLEVDLEYYITRPELQEIQVAIVLRAMNGSLPEGIVFHYTWLHSQGAAVSTSNGFVDVRLPVPSEPGTYSLFYNIASARLVLGITGEILIIVVLEDTLASQGIGVAGAALTLLVSVMIGLVPVIRRRHIST